MEVLTQLRLGTCFNIYITVSQYVQSPTRIHADLVDELHSLPEVLQSAFPDLAVDFLANVFQDAIGKTVTRYVVL